MLSIFPLPLAEKWVHGKKNVSCALSSLFLGITILKGRNLKMWSWKHSLKRRKSSFHTWISMNHWQNWLLLQQSSAFQLCMRYSAQLMSNYQNTESVSELSDNEGKFGLAEAVEGALLTLLLLITTLCPPWFVSQSLEPESPVCAGCCQSTEQAQPCHPSLHFRICCHLKDIFN